MNNCHMRLLVLIFEDYWQGGFANDCNFQVMNRIGADRFKLVRPEYGMRSDQPYRDLTDQFCVGFGLVENMMQNSYQFRTKHY